MQSLSFPTVLIAAVVAGLIAGLVTAGFHTVATEPVIDHAIRLEEAAHTAAAGAAKEPLVVSRDVQRAGIFLGYVLYGISLAFFFSIAYRILAARLPVEGWLRQGGPARRGVLLAGLAYWSVGLLPFLKYPASPPGVGDPETIGYRQGLYLVFLVASIIATALAMGLGGRLGSALGSTSARWTARGVLAVLFGAALIALMPANPDQASMPVALVEQFRALTLIGITIFWTVFAAGIAWMLRSKDGDRLATTL